MRGECEGEVDLRLQGGQRVRMRGEGEIRGEGEGEVEVACEGDLRLQGGQSGLGGGRAAMDIRRDGLQFIGDNHEHIVSADVVKPGVDGWVGGRVDGGAWMDWWMNG